MNDERIPMPDDSAVELGIRRGLLEMVPAPPTDLALAEGARAYARRSRVARSVAAAAAIVVVVGGGAWYASAGTTVDNSQPTTPPTAVAADPNRPFACRTPWEPPPANAPAVGISHGAVLARLCPLSVEGLTPALEDYAATGPDGANWAPPSDPLTQGLDRLADQVNGLPAWLPDESRCRGRSGPSYSLVFQYPGGRLEAVQGDALGCDLVASELMGRRLGAASVVDAYTSALLAQRAGSQPPDNQVMWTQCPESFGATPLSPLTLAPDVDLTRALVCDYALGGLGSLTAKGTLSSSQLERLNADVAAHASRDARRHDEGACGAGGSSTTQRFVFGYNAWGDLIGILGSNCFGYQVFPDLTWYPDGATQRMLDSASDPL